MNSLPFSPSAGLALRVRRAALCVLALVALLMLASGCATRVPAPAPTGELALPEAAVAALEQLMPLAAPGPAWVTSLQRRSIVIEPVQDTNTGEQTLGTVEARFQLVERLRLAYPEVERISPNRAATAEPTWLLRGALAVGRGPIEQRPASTLRLAIFDLKTGALIGEASVAVRADSIDNTPTAFFQDSPVVTAGSSDAATSAAALITHPKLDSLGAVALLDLGMVAYDGARYAEALAHFEAAAQAPGADPMRVATGLYLTRTRLGQAEPAKQAFAQIVAIGLARRSLAVKFLFEPGKVEFWADPKVSGNYPMWLEQIAARAKSRSICLTVLGHSSRTGSEAFNDQLSLQRAVRIGDALRRLEPGFTVRLQEIGMGFRENLVGTGTDDFRDALDRRVEFKFDGC